MDITWQVAPKHQHAAGQYFRRAWPSASYTDGKPAVRISCRCGYSKTVASTGLHSTLKVYVADYSQPDASAEFTWVRISTSAALDSAKRIAVQYLTDHPHMQPKESAK